jgi:hypothetical protein
MNSLTSLNYSLAAKLTEIATDGQTNTVDELWDTFIHFYTKLDQHNCPDKQNNMSWANMKPAIFSSEI